MSVRRTAVVIAAALAAGLLVSPPAVAADAPVALHDRDAAQPVYEIDSDPAGTVFVTTDGAVRLVRAPMTPDSPRIDLGDRGAGEVRDVAQEVSVQDGRVAIPEVAARDDYATSVRWCLVADCPTTSTLTVPAGYHYLGNAGDVALVHNRTTHTLGLLPWTGGVPQTVALPDAAEPYGAYGDAQGIVLWDHARAHYIARPSLTVTAVSGRRAYLTPSSIVLLRIGSTSYRITRVPRSNPGGPPSGAVADDFVIGNTPRRIVATDDAVAWTMALPPEQRQHAPEQARRLLTSDAADGGPVDSGPAEWTAFAPLEGTDAILTHRDGPDGRGFYAVTPGSTDATLVHALPARRATAGGIWVSGDRVAYTDDSTIGGSAFVRDVPGGVPGDETRVSDLADTVAISGPYVAVSKGLGPARPGVVAGRLGGTLTPTGGWGEPVLSGHRLLAVSVGVRRYSLATPEPRYERPWATAAVFGDAYYAAGYDGGIQRRDLRTGALRTVRPANCSGCVYDQSAWQLWAWGDELLYALDFGPQGRATGLWNATTGETTPLPMLAAGWTELSYRDGLLLVHRAGDGVRVYDLHAGTNALVDATGDLPYGNGIGPRVLAWRDADGVAVVRPIADFLPGYQGTTRHVNEVVPPGLIISPGEPDAVWAAEWYLSDDSDWQLELRQGSASGAVVRTITGATENEAIRPAWDGTDGNGGELPHGSYAWTLTSDAGTRTGTVFLSRHAPPTPTLSAPVLVSDESASRRFTLRWDGAPDGHRYVLQGPLVYSVTTNESRTVTTKYPVTYRYNVRVEDPAGRRGEPAKSVTVQPFDDADGDPYVAGQWARSTAPQHWLGAQQRSSVPGAKYAFWASADGVWLIGAKGPSYGKFRVTIGGKSWVYDAYSPTVRYRQVLFKTALPWAKHHVVVEVLATPGRTRVGIDGLAARRPE